MGSLAVIYKDEEIEPDAFSHLADLIVHHAPIDKGQRFGRKHKFEANKEELEKLRWLSKFANIDILYCYDRSEDIRKRMFESQEQSFNFKANVILVQKDNQLRILKADGGAKHTCMPFASASRTEPSHESNNIFNADFVQMRVKILQHVGERCEKCGYDTCIEDLLLIHRDNNRPIEFSRFGVVREFNELLHESANCDILCSRCYHEKKYGTKDKISKLLKINHKVA